MTKSTAFRNSLFMTVALLAGHPSQAATLSFSGNITYILTDTGGVFSGASLGDSVGVTSGYGDSAGDAGFVDVQSNQTWWDFSAGVGIGGSLNFNNSSNFSMTSAGVSVRNDFIFDDSNFLDDQLNITYNPPIANGTPVDGWQLTGESADGSIGFGLFLTSLDTSLYSNMDYQVNPPSWQDIDYASFAIREVDASGDLIFMAFGSISDINGVSAVPIPAAAWLFSCGLISLLGMSVRRKRNSSEI